MGLLPAGLWLSPFAQLPSLRLGSIRARKYLHSESRGRIATAPRQYICQDHGVRSVGNTLSRELALSYIYRATSI